MLRPVDRTVQTVPAHRIVLTGFMGSGKTTVGRSLATMLAWRFTDLDDAVAERAGKTVPEIFAQDGEAAFRRAEEQALAFLVQSRGLVIALGGGALETAGVRQRLSQAPDTVLVHLDAPFDTLYERCRMQARDPRSTFRPLLGDPDAALERYRRRRPIYATHAHHTVHAGGSSPEAVALAILSCLYTHAPTGIQSVVR